MCFELIHAAIGFDIRNNIRISLGREDSSSTAAAAMISSVAVSRSVNHLQFPVFPQWLTATVFRTRYHLRTWYLVPHNLAPGHSCGQVILVYDSVLVFDSKSACLWHHVLYTHLLLPLYEQSAQQHCEFSTTLLNNTVQQHCTCM